MSAASLIEIRRDGSTESFEGELPEAAADVTRVWVGLYETVGFEEPWVCYLAIEDSRAVGTCGFKSPPANGRVEIAYFTFPEFEGRGVATTMARQLIAVAQKEEPGLTVAAQTLPERNASTRILEKVGFKKVGTVLHPEDGEVWEWHLPSEDRREADG